jgi:PAS domain S-box-containing protein
MPFTTSGREARLLDFLRRFREKPVWGYALAVAAVMLAVLGRLALGGYIEPGIAFVTYYPAIVAAAFFGGLGPASLAIALSIVSARLLFLPPHGWGFGEVPMLSLLVFLIVSETIVALIVFLNHALERVVAREEEIRSVIEAAPNGIFVLNRDGEISLCNASAETLFGFRREELVGQDFRLLVQDWAGQDTESQHASLLEEAGRDASGRRKDGSQFPMELGLRPLRRGSDHATIAAVVDLSEREKAAEQEKLLMREMRHRTQNLFAVICAVIRGVLTEKRPVTQAREVLLARVQALARAHGALSSAAWRGAPLQELVRQELAAFTDRAEIRGCDLVVDSRAALHFALILHELATNAAKYGALSVPGGRVLIEGSESNPAVGALFTFRWQEVGGPPAATPLRKGFGSFILSDVAKRFGRSAMIEYAPSGVSYELVVRLDTIRAAPQADDTLPPEPAGHSALA